jgi:hypothetical protein
MPFVALLFCFLVPAQAARANESLLSREALATLSREALATGQELSDEKNEVPPPSQPAQHNNPPSQPAPYNKGVFWAVTGIQVAGYSTALVALNHAWYKDHPRSSLHFHNDIGDWKQMDKFGHVNTTYHLSRLGAQGFRLSGMDRIRSAWLGTASGLGFMTLIEVLDGLSEEWGFSAGDQAANMLGSAFFVAQEYLWQEQRMTWKFSFRKTEMAGYRPEVLGSNLPENLIKDYNGMSFWASFNLASFNPASGSGRWEWLPPWLNIAAGYGAYGMLGGSENPTHHEGTVLPHFERHRRWFLSPDIDFTRIPTDNAFLKALFQAMNFIKIPAPALEYNNHQGWQIHIIYF